MTGNKNEWHVPIPAEDIATRSQHYDIEADDATCHALAQRLNIEAVNAARARFEIHRDQAGYRIVVDGRLQAEIVQQCVVTLEPVVTHIEETFDAYFADTERVISFARAQKKARAEPEQANEVESPMVEEHEEPEPLDNGCVDLGELAAQYLSLGMPAYPKKEGARHELTDEDIETARDPSPARRNPFEALKNWRTDREDDES